jgi:hypothetical protein
MAFERLPRPGDMKKENRASLLPQGEGQDEGIETAKHALF